MAFNAGTIISSKANVENHRTRTQTNTESDESEERKIKVYQCHSETIKQWKLDDSIALSYEDINPQCFENGIDDKNIIHRAIQDGNSSRALLQAKGLDFIEYLVVRKPELFTARDDDAKIPIIEASKRQIPLLFRVVNLLLPDKIAGRIDERCNEGQQGCPLLEVAKMRREHCRIDPEEINTPRTPKSPKSPKSPNIRRQATLEMGISIIPDCIHDEIDVEKLLKEDSQLRKLIKEVLSSGERGQYSCLHNLLGAKLFNTPKSNGTHTISISGLRSLLSLFPDSVFTELSPQGKTALHMTVSLYEEGEVDYELLCQAIEVLVERYPQSIFTESNIDGQTAYRLLKDLNVTDDSSKWIKATEELFKRTCIGTEEYTKPDGTQAQLSLEMKRKFLYWDTISERQFSLNLTGESTILDGSYIKDIVDRSGIRFETVVDSVILPYWKPTPQWKLKDVDPPQESEHYLTNEVNPLTPQGENDPYDKIFDWLWKSEVRKIFTLEVDDRGPEPHSNAAIRQCLRGNDNSRDFEVSVFKWKKFDICSETLSIAASKAREVWLYSSGNTAVLRSWACCSGLAKLRCLEKLVVNVFPKTPNDKKDCIAYEEEFRMNLHSNCRSLTLENIIIEIHGYNKVRQQSMNHDKKLQAGPESKPKAEDWVNRLKNFKGFMINILNKFFEKPSINVAVLDDGSKLTNLSGKQVGISFCPSTPTYFVGPCEHGTEMARCIRDICPMADLYIARLDDSRELENQRFTTMSCHQALRWAIDMQVDVICMSWSFRKKGIEQDEHEKIFTNLVKEAIGKDIILFGSLPDRGPGEKTDSLAPVGLDGVLKIGSATPHGESVSENRFADTDFILPGESLHTQSDNPDRGSSYATAYASGLAALALCVVKAHHQLAQLTEGDYLHKALYKAKTYDGMRIIFNRLSGQSPKAKIDRGAFVQPYEVFGQDFSAYETAPDDAQAKDVLERIINHILPPEVLNTV